MVLPLPGDSVGMGFWINDNGQAVGASGSCANTVLPPIAASRHAIPIGVEVGPCAAAIAAEKVKALM
jgi:hypothetical protein